MAVRAARRIPGGTRLWPCLAVASGAAVRRWLSRAIARPRPPEQAWLTEPEGFSLPSKHTTLAVLTVGACVRADGIGDAPARAAPLLAAAGVGASRVYLGVHWPADVIADWLFAEGWLRLAGALTVPAPPGRQAGFPGLREASTRARLHRAITR